MSQLVEAATYAPEWVRCVEKFYGVGFLSAGGKRTCQVICCQPPSECVLAVLEFCLYRQPLQNHAERTLREASCRKHANEVALFTYLITCTRTISQSCQLSRIERETPAFGILLPHLGSFSRIWDPSPAYPH